MIGEGLLSASTIDSKDTTPLLDSHRTTGFKQEGGGGMKIQPKSLCYRIQTPKMSWKLVKYGETISEGICCHEGMCTNQLILNFEANISMWYVMI
jgi:hypothetical protein